MRFVLLGALLALAGCAESPVPSAPDPVPVSSPAPATVTPTPDPGSFSLELDPKGWGRVLVTNHLDAPAWVVVVWERETQAGRIESARQGHVIPAHAVASFWPDCFWGRGYRIGLPGHGVWIDHYYGALYTPAVPSALDKYGPAGVCHRSEPPY